MRPACRLAGSSGMVSLLAGVQSNTRLSCAAEIVTKAQSSSAAKMEKFLIVQVFAVGNGWAKGIRGEGITEVPGWGLAQARVTFGPGGLRLLRADFGGRAKLRLR